MESREGSITTGSVKGRGYVPLGLPPSCVEFCPAHPEYILVGTYNLQEGGEDYTGTGDIPYGGQAEQRSRDGIDEASNDEEGASGTAEQSRNGSLILYRRQDESLKHVQTLPTPSAIFDLHFHPHPDYGHVFGAVSSTGTFITGRVVSQMDDIDNQVHDKSIQIEATCTVPDIGKDVLFTSFIWNPALMNGAAITTNKGQVWLVTLTRGSIERTQQIPILSNMETWCVAIADPIDNSSQYMVYSGSDDGILRFTSLRMLAQNRAPAEKDKPLPSTKSGVIEGDTDIALWEQSFSHGPHMIGEFPTTSRLIKNQHNAGVTAILPLPIWKAGTGLIATGSYDEYFRVFVVRNPQDIPVPPELLFEQSLGGGVWKLKLMNFYTSESEGNACSMTADILASCMHAGPKILRLHVAARNGVDTVTMKVVHEFEGHTLNYASDCQRLDGGEIHYATTSFYDKKLHWWTQTP